MSERVYACERPEALPERGVTWFHTSTPCRPCLWALEAAVRRFPGHIMSDGTTRIEESLARARRTNDRCEV